MCKEKKNLLFFFAKKRRGYRERVLMFNFTGRSQKFLLTSFLVGMPHIMSNSWNM